MRTAGILATCAAIAIASCSEMPRIGISNNTDSEFVLLLRPMFLGGASAVSLAPGEIKSAYFGAMLPPGAVIRVGACDLGYDIPIVDHEYYREADPYKSGLVVQVEPDFSVTLLPADRRVEVSPEDLAELQQRFGFPIRPAFKSCRGAGEPASTQQAATSPT